MKESLYIRLTKTGSTSFLKTINRSKLHKGKIWTHKYDGIDGKMDCQLRAAQVVRDHFGEHVWNATYKFTIVRNPFCRIVSSWRFVSKYQRIGMTNPLIRDRFAGLEFKEFVKRLSELNLVNPYNNEFVRPGAFWWHVSPLYIHITDENGI